VIRSGSPLARRLIVVHADFGAIRGLVGQVAGAISHERRTLVSSAHTQCAGRANIVALGRDLAALCVLAS